MIRSILFLLISIFFISFSSEAQLIADFSVNKNTGCGFVSIQFTDLSTNNGLPVTYKSLQNGDAYNSHQWIFENNGQSFLQNPLTSFSTPGTFDITLIVNNGTAVDTIIKTDFIVVYAIPAANFTSDDSAGCVPFTVNFTDLSIEADTNIVSWSWNFGDGAFDTLQQNPSHEYVSIGTYTVFLQITDANGCQAFKNMPLYVQVTASPQAGFSVSGQSIACDTPLTVNFINSSIGNYLTYLWDFGDSSTSNLSDPSHTYLDSGLFDVSLIVSDQNGCSDTALIPDAIAISDVVASFALSKDTLCPYEPVTVTSTSLNGVTFTWNFGDGSGTSTASPATYSYSAAGDYEILLVATGPGGACRDSITDSIHVELVDANFSANPVYGCDTPLVVQFTNTSVNDVSWEWFFGDGDTSTLENPVNTYNSEGSFTDMLIVTSANQCKDTVVVQNDINIFILKPDFIADSLFGCIPLPVNFTNTTSPSDSALSFLWDFGDGSTSTLENPTHTYTTDGEFTVTLTIIDVSGCSHDTGKFEYIIAGFPQNLDFTVDMDTACADTMFSFSDLSTDQALIDEWSWSIGAYDTLGNPDPPPPGTPFGNTDSPTYTPTDTGFMWIQLIVGYNGCKDTLLRDSFIYVLGPYINITNSFVCDTPFTYNFSLTDSLGIQRWYWDFGDGSPLDSVNFNASHTYSATGDYVITDSTFNDSTGCKMVKTTNIMVRDIMAEFSMDDTIGCLPFSINFDGSPSQDEVSYQWDFADSTGTFTGGPLFNHIFDLRGIFGVKLIATDVNGCLDSVFNEINVYKPYAYFAADTLSNCVPFLVDFIDTSKSDTGVVAWNWSFGDAGIDSVQNPSYSYSTPGAKTVTLIVTDSLGCKDTLSKTNYIIPLQPYPSFSASDNTVCFGSPVDFSNSTTYPNSNGANLTYQWDFGDNQSSTAANPQVNYGDTNNLNSDTGYFSISLLAIDTVLGCDSSIQMNNFIHVQPVPVANFTSSATFSPCYNPPDPPQIYFYNTSITDYQDSISWYFGDGTSSTLQNDTVGHAYTYPDTFDVQIIVETTYGCIDTLLQQDYIIVVGPTADIEVSPDTVCVGELVTYTMVNANNVVEFSWDFGDGAGALGTNDSTTYSYNQVGFLYPKLIYSFANGACEQIAADTIFVHQVLAGFAGDTVPCRDVPVVFSNSSLGADNFEWDFGDGSPVVTGTGSTSHTFSVPGNYMMSLAIENLATGCVDTIFKTIDVFFSCDSAKCNLDPPVVNSIPDTAIIIGEEVTLYTTTQYASTVSWFPPDSLSCINCLDPVAQPFTTTKYIVSVKDENDCFTGYDTVEIRIIDKHSLDVPSAFTPNGDGLNDTVFVRGWGIKSLISFQVYNRWGQIVYESTDIKAGWDGTYKNQPQNAETYVYVVSVEYYGGSTDARKGYITLIR